MTLDGSIERIERKPRTASEFLEVLQNRESIADASKVAVVVAHPDDESIAFGAQLHRFSECFVIHITDGVPLDSREWEDKGFKSPDAYGRMRNREMHTALDRAGHTGLRQGLGIPDQRAALSLAQTACRLADMFEKQGTRFVLTHAYEGGHPDHDATAFAVHTAKKLLAKKGILIEIIEAPLYRVNPETGKSVRQSFVPIEGTETFEFILNDDERALKKELYQAHASQNGVLSTMSTTTEWLRVAPEYDFTRLPNNGHMSHLYPDSEINPERWLTLTTEALKILELVRARS